MNAKFFSIILIFSLFSICFGGTIDPSVPDDRYLDYAKKFNFIAKVVGDKEYYASAVLINKNTFLTSAHVAKKIKKIIVEDKEFDIIDIKIHGSYKKQSHNNDIAIGKIKENFNLDFYPELYCDSDELGKVVSICGYGSTGDFSTGKTKSDKKKRAGSNIIFQTSKYMLYCSPSDKKKTELEFVICHGDSGGGLFIENKLAGLNCFIEPSDGTYNSDYDDICGHVRISHHFEWIKESLKD